MDAGRAATVEYACAAKLNLFLEVLARRNDGFHEIETLMSAVSIYDSLYFSTNSEGHLRLTCNWASGREALRVRTASGHDVASGLPQDAENLAWKAVDHLRRTAGISAGATIRLIKRIPASAGLGGASSNAAAALLAANHVWRLGWTVDQLARLGADLGSDVPFFIAGRSPGAYMAVCRGRGERIEAVKGMARMHLIVVRPPEGLSTPAVYARCRPAAHAKSVQPLVESLRGGDWSRSGTLLFNRLQPAAAELTPWIDRIQTAFERLGVLGHALSGSGTSYFGLCRDARQARRFASVLRAAHLGHVFTARTASAPSRLISRAA